MALTMYDRGFFYVNGKLLGESSGGSIEYQGDPIPVDTLVQDLAGFTPVPKHAMIQVDEFVPAVGFDLDAIKLFLDNEFVTAKMQMGGSGIAMQADGMIMGPTLTTSATDSSKLTFKILVQAKPFE